jgi:hypothetical protein
MRAEERNPVHRLVRLDSVALLLHREVDPAAGQIGRHPESVAEIPFPEGSTPKLGVVGSVCGAKASSLVID